MGVEINRLGNSIPTHSSRSRGRDSTQYVRIPDMSIELDTEPSILHLQHETEASSSSDNSSSSTGELAGVYLGILNLYTTLPQFIATGISMVVFSVLEPGKSPELAKDAHPDEHHGTDGPNAIAVCLFIGALSSVGAAYATQRLKYVH